MGFSLLLSLLSLAAGSPAPDLACAMNRNPSPAPAQEAPVGTWKGTLSVPGGELPLVFHIRAGEGGALSATMDSPAQGATGIPMSEVEFADGHLRLFSAAAQGEYEGNISDDGTELTGVWKQGGGEYELNLVKDGTVREMEPTEAQKPIVGTWLGTLEVPGGSHLRMVFHIGPAEDGGLTATMDSPDQGANGLPVSEVQFAEGHLRLFSAMVAGTFEGDLSSDGTVLEGKWMQGGMEIALTLERTEGEVLPPARPQEPQKPLPYDEEEVRYTNREGGHALGGTLTLPRGGGSHPAVVLVSGSGPQDRDEAVFGHQPFLVLADHLTRQGIAVLRYDDRGVGESEGDFGTATTEEFVSDALAGVAYLKGRSEIDPGSIGLIGHSEGGLVAPLAAVGSRDVAFIVMMAGPGVTGEEVVLEQAALIARASGASDEAIRRNRELQERLFAVVKQEPDPDLADPRLSDVMRGSLAEMTDEERSIAGLTGAMEEQVVQTQVKTVNSPWFRFFLTYDPVPTLRNVTVPVLAINGERDLQVSPQQNLPVIEAALKGGGNRDATVMELPGLNHLFQHATTGAPSEYMGIEETIAPSALDLISDWILERAKRGR